MTADEARPVVPGQRGYGAAAWYREVAAVIPTAASVPPAADRAPTAYYRRGRQVCVRYPDPVR